MWGSVGGGGSIWPIYVNIIVLPLSRRLPLLPFWCLAHLRGLLAPKGGQKKAKGANKKPKRGQESPKRPSERGPRSRKTRKKTGKMRVFCFPKLIALEDAKYDPREAKSCPREAQERPRAAQERPRAAQGGSVASGHGSPIRVGPRARAQWAQGTLFFKHYGH